MLGAKPDLLEGRSSDSAFRTSALPAGCFALPFLGIPKGFSRAPDLETDLEMVW